MGRRHHLQPERPSESSTKPDRTSPATLGDVLYREDGQALVPERDWVALVDSVAAGDQAALHALYERASRAVFTLVARITRSAETAQELTIDVFYDVWRRAASYDPANGTVLGWIMNQARSRAIDRVRFERRKKRVNPHAGEERAEDEAAGSRDAVEIDEQRRALHAALELLTADERRAIEAAYISQLTHSEVAARLNEPLGTIKTRIRSGLNKLRQALAPGANDR